MANGRTDLVVSGSGKMKGYDPVARAGDLGGIRAKWQAGSDPVTIVCLGDRVTGLYYVTGGERAYTDMLGIALERIYPSAKVSITGR